MPETLVGFEVERTSDYEDVISKARWAISDLFLDTELQDNDYKSIVRILKETRLSLQELERIYEEEVAPATYLNLRVPAGAWGAFNQAWLRDKIDRKKGWIRFLKKNHFLWDFYKAWVTRDTISDWKRIRKALETTEAEK